MFAHGRASEGPPTGDRRIGQRHARQPEGDRRLAETPGPGVRSPGARLFVNGRPAGITPVDVALCRRDRDVVLRFEKDGYDTTEMPLDRSLSAWLWGNVAWLTAGMSLTEGNYDTWDDVHALAWGSAFTFGVDLLTGAAFKFPREVITKLDTASAGATTPVWREGIILPAAQAPAADLIAAGAPPHTAPAGDRQ